MKKAKLKEKIKKEEEKKVETISIKNSIIVVFMMLLVLVGFYFLTEKLLEKKAKDEKIEIKDIREINNINYSDIDDIVSDSYYILFTKKDDEKNDEYDKYINTLAQYNFDYSFYYIDLSKKANKDLYNKKEEKIKKLDDIQVKDTTLIFVEDGKIKDSYVGSDDILKHLSSFFEDEKEASENENKETEESKKEDVDKESKK